MSSLTGSDTSAFDRFRQGVETKDLFDRRRSLPILRPEAGSFFITSSVYGQARTYSDSTPYADIVDFDPVVFIQDELGTQMFPAIVSNINIQDPSQLNGVFEPLAIRSKTANTSIDYPYEAHDIRASLAGGSENPFAQSSIKIEQTYNSNLSGSVVIPFIDSGDYFGLSLTGSVFLPGEISFVTPRLDAYTDMEKVTFTRLGVTLTSNDIIDALRKMSGSTDNFLPDNTRVKGAGFTYGNNVAGTDSIAFGGLKL